jgi:bacterial leucyl aminopeptidase
MHLQAALAVLAAACQLVHASPAAEDLQVNKGLRLIKTSEEDPGQWVTEDEKDKLVVAGKYVGFIDITDIKVRLHA